MSFLLREYINILIKIFITPINFLEKYSVDKISLFIRNAKNKLTGYDHYFSINKKNNLYYVNDKNHIHYFANRRRGFDLYRYGLGFRANTLANSYILESIKFESGDVVIDCGSNYADLWLFLKNFIKEENYISFEPGSEEHSSISLNVINGKNYNIGLGEENKENQFYINHSDADSSFIEPSEFSEIVNCKTIKLDTFIEENNISSIKLLKLEAEGFEPEILKGSKKALKIIEYIAIDGGKERGVNQEETFTFQSNFLYENGFTLIGVNFQWSRALFKKKEN